MDITPQGDHEYVVRTHGIESRIRVTPDVLNRVSVTVADEPRVVEASVTWLLERQAAADLPPLIDLDDIADAYEDYVSGIGRQLAAS